jgi:hypothetical protein
VINSLQHASHEHVPLLLSQTGVAGVDAVKEAKMSASSGAGALDKASAPPTTSAGSAETTDVTPGSTDTTVGGGGPVAPRSADMTAEPVVESTSTAPSTAARVMVVKAARECIVQQCRFQCGGKGKANAVGRAR